MGAEFVTQVYKVNAPDVTGKVRSTKDWYEYYVDTCQYESGHGGYSGTAAESPGLTITGRVFYSTREAEDWLLETCRKWNNTIAVSVRTDRGEYVMFGGIYSS